MRLARFFPAILAAFVFMPLAMAQGTLDKTLNFVFGATESGGIFIKVGLFIILYAILLLSARKVLPPEQSNVAAVIAFVVALLAMKFMPEKAVMGLGKAIWIAALALLPYTVISLFFKKEPGKKNWAKWLFVIIAYIVLLLSLVQLGRFPGTILYLSFGSEIIEDILYTISFALNSVFGALYSVFTRWEGLLIALGAIIVIWLIVRWAKKKPEPEGKISEKPPKEKKPGIFGRGYRWGKDKVRGGVAGGAKLLGKGAVAGGKGIKRLWRSVQQKAAEEAAKKHEEEQKKKEKGERERMNIRRLGRGLKAAGRAAMEEEERKKAEEEEKEAREEAEIARKRRERDIEYIKQAAEEIKREKAELEKKKEEMDERMQKKIEEEERKLEEMKKKHEKRLKEMEAGKRAREKK